MLNFTVGPVMTDPAITMIANSSTPYFRTSDFSAIMKDNEKLMLEFLNAPEESKCVFLTSSGTGAMESCVMNILNEKDKVIIINGGSFGQRFVELCSIHRIGYTEVKCDFGNQVRSEQLEKLEDKGYTALLVNMDETSSGVLYNMEMISNFCKKKNLLLIVDAISAFLSDNLDMSALKADAVITSSQKALAVQPGISIIALSSFALDRVRTNPEKGMYLSLKDALKNAERGQTPFTPAVTILLQINYRLNRIKAAGGIGTEKQRIEAVAKKVRNRLHNYPFEFVIKSDKDRSNAVTAVRPLTCGAKKIVQCMKDDYQIWVCPNGGDMADRIFRIGHIGYIRDEDINCLFSALDDMKKRKII